MKGLLAIALVAAMTWLSGCILPKGQPAAGIGDDDDDLVGDDDDVLGDDDDVVGDDDDVVGDDDDVVGDDDDVVGDDDDVVGDDDDAATPDHPVGDFTTVWSWLYTYQDPQIGSEYMTYASVWAIANNGINGMLYSFALDEFQNQICTEEISLAGSEMTPSFPVATAGWNTSGTFQSNTCYPELEGTNLQRYFAIAPKLDAFLQIETDLGLPVADQINAEQTALNDLGLTETDYFMYHGVDASDMAPLGFVFEM